METKMKTIIRNALVALALSGAAIAGSGSANAAGSVGFYIGPNGVHINYATGYYYDRFHHRHMYDYPVGWQAYPYPLMWYRTHPDWYRDRDWGRDFDRDRDHDRDRH
jgi:hypothetical protein